VEARKRLLEAYERLRPLTLDPGEFVVSRATTLFEVLVATVLSQNTSDRLAIRALENLRRLAGHPVTPEAVLRTSPSQLLEAVKPAGMQRQRAERLRAIAEALARAPGLLDRLKGMGVEEARRALMRLPGVGPKTADVVLMVAGKATFPVDTHISRVMPRLLGLERASYEEMRTMAVEALREPDRLRELHMKLILVGRRWCRPRQPRCESCPLAPMCAYAQKRHAA